MANLNRTVAERDGGAAAPDIDSFQTEGILGRIPDDVESIAELMLQDSDVNVYQQQKVVLREEGFTIRGKKQKTQEQKMQLIRERKHQAWMMYKKMEERKKARFAADENISLIKAAREEEYYANPANDVAYRPKVREVKQLQLAGNLKGLGHTIDFEAHDQRVRQQRMDRTMNMTRQLEESTAPEDPSQIDTGAPADPVFDD